MKKYNYILLIFTLFLYACTSAPQKMEHSTTTVEIDINSSERLDFEKNFDSVQYIPLETNKDVLIGEITKMYLDNEHIIIFDQKAMSIFLFGIDGKFIRKIGKKGEGPDEYLYINDIQFDKEQMLILAHERLRNCIYTYDLSGNLVNKSPTSSVMFNSFFKVKEGVWVYSCFSDGNPENYNLTLLTPNLQNVKKQYFSQKEFVNITFSSTFMSDGHGKLFFYYPSSNIIYEISETDVKPFLQVNFGNRSMPYDRILKAGSMEEYDKLVSEKKYLGDINRCFANRDRIFFSFMESGLGKVKFYNCFYNIRLKETNVFDNAFMSSTTYPILPALLHSTDTTLVYQIKLPIITEESLTTLSSSLSTNIQIDSNPVLAICSLKEQQ